MGRISRPGKGNSNIKVPAVSWARIAALITALACVLLLGACAAPAHPGPSDVPETDITPTADTPAPSESVPTPSAEPAYTPEPDPTAAPSPEPSASPSPSPEVPDQTLPEEDGPSGTDHGTDEQDWMLILVNADNPIPEDFSVTLKELRNGQQVDERIYPMLQQMFDDAREEGIFPYINESFRTWERQQEIMDDYMASYEAEGLSREEAEQEALKIVAVPGTSEHQLGLALDIIAEYEEDSSSTWQWLAENSWRYGFILRYPEDKTDLTGISFEPWHFRYVGPDAAAEITESGVCLEEYISLRQHSSPAPDGTGGAESAA